MQPHTALQNDYLSNLNAHERDAYITFEEGPHKYTINGDDNYISVTTWNHCHFEQFDADKIISTMRKSPKWNQNKYFGKTTDEIKALWTDNCITASSAGTKMHYDIECFYNNNPQENNSIEYKYFIKFVADNNMVPYRTEWMIWDHNLRLAGSVDMVFENQDGTLMIYDWKRCKEIKKTSSFSKFSTTDCIQHLPDSNYWHYVLQLNTYKCIIETNYGKTVTHMRLVCLHPDNKSYIIYDVPSLTGELLDLCELRKSLM